MKKLFFTLCTLLLLSSTNLFATDYEVSGAGMSEVNGTYAENGTYNGKSKYEYADGGTTYYLFFLDDMEEQWVIFNEYYTSLHMGNEAYYYVNSSASTPPSSGWQVGWEGDAPAPSVSSGPSLSYNTGGFIESTTNDGSMANSITITLSNPEGITFSGSNGTFSSSNYTSANVPSGLTLVITKDSDTELQVNLTGNASSHTNNDNVNDLTITFLDAAFNGGIAADVSNSSKNDLFVDYYYEIATLADLQTLSNTQSDWDERIIQTADIDASATSGWNSGAGFLPIGDGSTSPYFTGSYDGGGHTIDNLYINRPSTSWVGLFGLITDGATITAIGVTNVNITGKSQVGGLVGRTYSSTVSNSYSTGSVTGTVTGTEYSVGGLVGSLSTNSTVSNSYSTCNVTGNSEVGGLVGDNFGSTVSSSYSTGNVTGNSEVGGLVGDGSSSSVSNSFWDTETSGQSSSAGATGKTTTEMKDYNTFTDETSDGLDNAWDFVTNPNHDNSDNDYWDMDQESTVNNGYPILSWQDGADDVLANAVWAGTTNTDWDIGTNWDDGNVPGIATNITIPNVTNDPVISASTAVEVNNLTVESGATLTIQSDDSNNGSLIVNGTSSGEVTYNRYVTAGNWHLVASPVSGQGVSVFVTGHSIATNNGYCGIAPYDNSTPGWAHYADDYSGADEFTPGKGYEVLSTADGTLPFIGTINTSDVSIALSAPASPGSNWNLIGNPFTASVNGNAPANASNNFIDFNTGALDNSYLAIYVWDASTDNYITVNNSSSAYYMAPGQAFFVYAVDGGGTVTFEEGAQNSQTGDLFKSSPAGYPAITLYAESEGLKKSTHVKYIDNMTTGLDPGYDAGRFSAGDNSFFISTRLVGGQSNKTNFDIQCLPLGDYSNVIPVVVNVEAGEQITFSIETNNLPVGVPVILEDRQNGIFTPLHVNGGSYQIVTEAKQEGTGRFYLHSQETSTGIDTRKGMPEVFVVPKPRYNKLSITGDLDKGATVSVYDIIGRKLIEGKLIPSQINEVDMHAIKRGIYIVEINSAGKRISKKINWLITP